MKIENLILNYYLLYVYIVGPGSLLLQFLLISDNVKHCDALNVRYLCPIIISSSQDPYIVDPHPFLKGLCPSAAASSLHPLLPYMPRPYSPSPAIYAPTHPAGPRGQGPALPHPYLTLPPVTSHPAQCPYSDSTSGIIST